MKVAILGAMEQEVALLKDSIKDITTESLQHLTVYKGQPEASTSFYLVVALVKWPPRLQPLCSFKPISQTTWSILDQLEDLIPN